MMSNVGLFRRTFSASCRYRMPRTVRDKRKAQVDDDLPADSHLSSLTSHAQDESKWTSFMNSRTKTSCENKIGSNFGNIRMDKDNVPQYSGQFDPYLAEPEDQQNRTEVDVEKFGGFYTQANVTPEDKNAQPESFFFDQSFQTKFTKFKPLVLNAEEAKVSNKVRLKKLVLDNQRSDGKTVDGGKAEPVHKTRVGQTLQSVIKPRARDDPESHSQSDLNYFDQITFKETYDRFNPRTVDQPQSLSAGPRTLKELNELYKSQGEEWNEVDKQYILPSVQAAVHSEHTEHRPAGTLGTPQDLDFIDEQFFSSPSITKSEADESLHEMQHSGREDRVGPLASVASLANGETSASKGTASKGQLTNKQDKKDALSTKTQNKSSQENTPNDVHIKPKKQKARTSPALDYVRNLRSSQKCEPSGHQDPVDLVGVGIAARLSSATRSLNATVSKKNVDTEEENLGLEKTNYLSVDKYSPPDLSKYTSIELEELLAGKVLYNDNELVALWKPYGLPMFSSSQKEGKGNLQHSLERYLPFLAKHLGYSQLLEVHRLDQTTTGVVLLATSESRRKHLKQLIAKREVVKTYYAITNGVPALKEGVINIPIGEGKVGQRFRPTIRPDYQTNKIISNKPAPKGSFSSASTEFRVLSSHGSAALVECIMLTGLKHQIRVHLGLALSTPVLGDNKYAWVDQLGPPQRIKGDILNRLRVNKTQARHLPIYLHARRISIPEVLEDKRLTITASKPHFFNKTQAKLKLHDSELIYP